MFKFLLLIAAASLASLGFADVSIQEYPEPIFQEEIFMNGDWLTKILAIIAGSMVCLRALGEALTRWAAKTEATWDDGLAKLFNQLLWLVGSAVGKFGYGAPKEIVKKDAQKLT